MKKDYIEYNLNETLFPDSNTIQFMSTIPGKQIDNNLNIITGKRVKNLSYDVSVSDDVLNFVPTTDGNITTSNELRNIIDKVKHDDIIIKYNNHTFESILSVGDIFVFILESLR